MAFGYSDELHKEMESLVRRLSGLDDHFGFGDEAKELCERMDDELDTYHQVLDWLSIT